MTITRIDLGLIDGMRVYEVRDGQTGDLIGYDAIGEGAPVDDVLYEG